MPDASGNGYWLVTKTGSVYTFGDGSCSGAPGSTGSPGHVGQYELPMAAATGFSLQMGRSTTMATQEATATP